MANTYEYNLSIHLSLFSFRLNTAVIHNCAAAIQVIVAYILSIQVFYDSEPGFSAIFGILLTMLAATLYFISKKDRELKPNGDGSQIGGNGIKYHMLAQS
jgi:hypothetical protein